MAPVDPWGLWPLDAGVGYEWTAHEHGVGTVDGVRIVRYRFHEPGTFGVHVDDALHQLSWRSDGVLGAYVDDALVMLPPDSAMWIPAGHPHDLVVPSAGSVVCVYLRADAVDAWPRPTVLAVDGLLRSLVEHLCEPLDLDAALRARSVLLDAIRRSPRTTHTLPMPTEPRARALAQRILDDPAHPASLVEHAAAMGVDPRTIRRRFQAETGLSVRDWTTRARLTASLPLLLSGMRVGEVAIGVGYESATGYIAAFRRQHGMTPAEFASRRT